MSSRPASWKNDTNVSALQDDLTNNYSNNTQLASNYLSLTSANSDYLKIADAFTQSDADALYVSQASASDFQAVASLDTDVAALGFIKSGDVDLSDYQTKSGLDTDVGTLGYVKNAVQQSPYDTLRTRLKALVQALEASANLEDGSGNPFDYANLLASLTV